MLDYKGHATGLGASVCVLHVKIPGWMFELECAPN